MPYADNDGMRVHYQVEGAGRPLVLQHGFTESIEDWLECGYVGALKPWFKLIMIDARGHGDSDKPHDPRAYQLEARRRCDRCARCPRYQAKPFLGLLDGGWIGFGLATFAPDRVDHLVIGGQHPFARDLEHLRRMVRTGIKGGPDAFVAAFHQTFRPAEGAFAERLRAADLQAYLALLQDRPGLDERLPAMSMPCCLYAGEADDVCDQAQRASERMPRAVFFSLPGLDHCEAFVRSELVLPQVMQFLQ